MQSRRDFLKNASILSGAIALPNVIPMSIQQAMAISAEPGSTFYDAEHIVFLMQENRSFDHVFGTLKGVRGFNNPRAKTLPNQNKVWLQNDEKGNTYAPFHVDIQKTKITWQGGLPHSWSDQVAARNKGKYDRWVPVKSVMSLGYYKRSDIPFYYALADAFTVCDHNFCSSLTGTTPNRLFFWTGTIRPEQNANSVPVVNNSQAESHDNVFVDWQTFPEVLEDNGISWKVYQNEIWSAQLPEGDIDDWLGNYGDNPLEYVKRHRVKLAAYFRKNGDVTSHPALSPEEVLARYNMLSERDKNLIDKAFSSNIDNPDYLKLAPFKFKNEKGEDETLSIPKEDIFASFRRDVDEGKLPTVSWLVAPQRFSDHTSSPLYVTWYVSEAIAILVKNPEVWKKTIFILTYDENDGYFDHLPPFVAPRPDDKNSGKTSRGIAPWVDFEFRKNSPIGLGYRVPMVIASPWSKGGYVNSQVFDHTSSLMFLENFLSKKTGKNIKSETISPWRRAICGDLTSVFRPAPALADKPVEPLNRDFVINSIQQAKSKPAQANPKPLSIEEFNLINSKFPFEVGKSSQAPHQEPGVRLACAIPYQAAVNSSRQGEKISLNFSAKWCKVGMPFNAYTKSKFKNEAGKTWAFAVVAGEELTYDWNISDFADGIYDLCIDGPNGFYRHFYGDQQAPKIAISVVAAQKGLLQKFNGDVKLTIHNYEEKLIKVALEDQFYSDLNKIIAVPAKGSQEFLINLQKSKGWYDIKASIPGFENFGEHFAGHIENGEVSISDPLMGGMLNVKTK